MKMYTKATVDAENENSTKVTIEVQDADNMLQIATALAGVLNTTYNYFIREGMSKEDMHFVIMMATKMALDMIEDDMEGKDVKN